MKTIRKIGLVFVCAVCAIPVAVGLFIAAGYVVTHEFLVDGTLP